MSSKKATLSDKFASLIDPTPSFDPEDEAEEDTRAKLTDTFDNDDEHDEVPVSALRRQAATVTLDEKRYAGKKVSRKDLELSSDEESGLQEDDDEEINEEGSQDEAQNEFAQYSEESSDDDNLMQSSDKLDDEEDDNEEDEESDEDGDMFSSEGATSMEDNSFKHFSATDSVSDSQKGAAVKNQLLLWDNLLELRIQMQKSLKAANQLPVAEDFLKFKAEGGKDFEATQKKSVAQISGLVNRLLDLQGALLRQNPETKSATTCKRQPEENTKDSDEEIPSSDEDDDSGQEENFEESPPKKKKRLDDFAPLLTSTYNDFLHYRNSTIQKWSDKTRIAQGKFSSKDFSAFEQSTLKQIEHIMADKGRLLKRTRTKRSNYRILGKDEEENTQTTETKSEDLCNEIFDDDDFYHQLLRELIEHKSEGISDPVQLGRQWIALQKYRTKMKRKIDTRATKGRKIRYTVMPKLVNFMAPMDNSSWTEEAKDELFTSIFAA